MSKREIFVKAWEIRKATATELGCKVSAVNMGECLKMAYKGTNTIVNTSVKLQGSEKQVAWATKIKKSLCEAIDSLANSNNDIHETYFKEDLTDMADNFVFVFEKFLTTDNWGKDIEYNIQDRTGIKVNSVTRKARREYKANKNNREYFNNMSCLLNNYLSEVKASVWIDRRYKVEEICKNVNTRISK